MTLDHALLDLTEARGVVLLLGLWLEGAAFARDQDAGESTVWHCHGAREVEHPGLVESLAGRVILLPVRVAGPRVGRHDDARLGLVDAGLPRIARLDEPAVPALERELPHVPHVALPVLRIPVKRSLDRNSVLGHRVP